jgi:hypothetical protein
MVSLTQDPKNPEQLIVTATVTVIINKVLIETLTDELTMAIREAAKEDLKSNPIVRQQVAKAAVAKLLAMLEGEKK